MIETNYRVLNGPLAGDVIAGPTALLGSAVCLPFSGPRGVMEYAVYVLVDVPTADRGAGLAYVRAWKSPREAQQHAHEISTAVSVARHVATTN